MKSTVTIRPEGGADEAQIAEVTVEAFKTLEVSRQTEQFIIGALRDAGALTVSLVAEVGGRVVGHVAFSPVTISDGTSNWFALGPVSVHPTLQRNGIGSALIREGLEMLRSRGAGGCCVVGHPEYYRKLGFGMPPDLGCEGVPAEVFFVLSFDGAIPRGKVTFHKAFTATG